MKMCCDYVIDVLKEKESGRFEGTVRIGFERGRIVAFSESNSAELADFQMRNIENDDEIKAMIQQFCNTGANGSIVVSYTGGSPDHYGYARTYKGDDLKKFLGLI